MDIAFQPREITKTHHFEGLFIQSNNTPHRKNTIHTNFLLVKLFLHVLFLEVNVSDLLFIMVTQGDNGCLTFRGLLLHVTHILMLKEIMYLQFFYQSVFT